MISTNFYSYDMIQMVIVDKTGKIIECLFFKTNEEYCLAHRIIYPLTVEKEYNIIKLSVYISSGINLSKFI